MSVAIGKPPESYLESIASHNAYLKDVQENYGGKAQLLDNESHRNLTILLHKGYTAARLARTAFHAKILSGGKPASESILLQALKKTNAEIPSPFPPGKSINQIVNENLHRYVLGTKPHLDVVNHSLKVALASPTLYGKEILFFKDLKTQLEVEKKLKGQ